MTTGIGWADWVLVAALVVISMCGLALAARAFDRQGGDIDER